MDEVEQTIKYLSHQYNESQAGRGSTPLHLLSGWLREAHEKKAQLEQAAHAAAAAAATAAATAMAAATVADIDVEVSAVPKQPTPSDLDKKQTTLNNFLIKLRGDGSFTNLKGPALVSITVAGPSQTCPHCKQVFQKRSGLGSSIEHRLQITLLTPTACQFTRHQQRKRTRMMTTNQPHRIKPNVEDSQKERRIQCSSNTGF